MKTTIDFPEDLLRRAKAEAALRGRKLRELVLEGVTRVLDQPEPAGPARGTAAKRPADGGGIVNGGGGGLASNPKPPEGGGRGPVPGKLPLLRPGRRPAAAPADQEIFADDQADTTAASAQLPSVHELMQDCCGMVDSGLRDLSTNPKHLEGLGRDSMGDR